MELTILKETHTVDITHYILKLTKNSNTSSDIIGATFYKRSSNKIIMNMPQGHSIKIDAGDDPIKAIKKELGVQ